MKKKWLAVILALAMCILTACSGSVDGSGQTSAGAEPTQKAESTPGPVEASPAGGVPVEELKIGIVANMVRDANGFFIAHDTALKATAQKLGLRDDQITWVENVPVTGSDCVDVIDTLAADGHQLIFVASSSYKDAVLASAPRHPEVKFMHFNGELQGDNLSIYQNRDYQAQWLTGYVAAKVSKVDQLGYVATFPELSVIRAVNAFADGARYANPNATVRVLWTHSWFDPPKEKESAQSLMNAGIQVIGSNVASPAVLQGVEELDGYATGFHVDMSHFSSATTLTSYLSLWEPIFTDAIKSVIDGTWHAQFYFWGMDKGCAGIAPINPDVASPELIAEVADLEAQIIAGTQVPFTGPLKDNKGNELVPSGGVMSDDMLLNMDFLIENVEGSL